MNSNEHNSVDKKFDDEQGLVQSSDCFVECPYRAMYSSNLDVTKKEELYCENDNSVLKKDLRGDRSNSTESSSFDMTIYNAITDVIGGSNANQFFCMSLPGMIIDSNQYKYDIKEGQPKPSHVKINESKLVNRLFDACKMSAADNGRQLQNQYRTALEVLTPKLNDKVMEAKNSLRTMLAEPYPYNFGDGSDAVLSLEQVFYKLYKEYAEAKQKWSQKQLDKKHELAVKYPSKSRADYQSQDDEYLDWYGTVAESELLIIDEKLGKVLSVFSPGDMKIINAILDSSSGREIADAKTTLENAGVLTPYGGYAYPVTLYPENWFELLDSSFTSIDLLESSTALAQKLGVLEAQRNNILTNINSLLELAKDQKDVKALKEAADAQEQAYSEAVKNTTSTISNASFGLINSVLQVVDDFVNPSVKSVASVSRIAGIDLAEAKQLIEKLQTNNDAIINSQAELVNAAEKATTSAKIYFEENNKSNLADILTPLRAQLDSVNGKIKDLQSQIDLAKHMENAVDPAGKRVYTPTSENEETSGVPQPSIEPNSVPDNFTQLLITSTMSSVSKQSSAYSSAYQSKSNSAFFFSGYTSKHSHEQAVERAMNSSSDMTVEIGMSVAKVQIQRDWFNPGLFILSRDMFSVSKMKIAPEIAGGSMAFGEDHFRHMNESIFSCFPSAFVIARDVTIRFSQASTMNSSFASSVEDHSSRGGGFFIFGGSSSSASSSSESNSVATSTSNSVTVRFKNPQIIGYYLEAIPADKSTYIGDNRVNSEFSSILEFIKKFQSVLKESNINKN